VETDVRHAAPPVSVAPLVVERAAHGDRESFTELVTTYHHDLLRLCLVICGDGDLARDATQAAWQHAWRKLAQLRDPSRVRPWLLRIAANEARQAFRRGRGVTSISLGLLDPPATDVDQISLLDLDTALARLSVADRQLIGLRWLVAPSARRVRCWRHEASTTRRCCLMAESW
jgi:DNA-directed RNA polymerase specialized sigma24 family protein